MIARALEGMNAPPIVIDIDDPLCESGDLIGEKDYEAFIDEGSPEFEYRLPDDEWQAISLGYTSGTTGNPKGVVCHHRGAYLNAVGQMLAFGIGARSRYLWDAPDVPLQRLDLHLGGDRGGRDARVSAGRRPRTRPSRLIEEHGVTHMCGAPVVLNLLLHAPDSVKRRFGHIVEVATGGAAPPSAVIEGMSEMGFNVTHLYGLTETYGPATVCAWQEAWDALDMEGRAGQMARQGVPYHTMHAMMVADGETMVETPRDGETIGELMLRGNTVMRGYLKNENATEEAFRGGWFHTGDLAVRHPDGYVEMKDRAKDIIISGGENISSLEVEECLFRHPKIMEAAVVARPDDHWGETVCAFVTPRDGTADLTEEEVVAWCRETDRALQDAAHRGVRPPAEDVDGKDSEVRAARTREIALSLLAGTRALDRCVRFARTADGAVAVPHPLPVHHPAGAGSTSGGSGSPAGFDSWWKGRAISRASRPSSSAGTHRCGRPWRSRPWSHRRLGS